MRKPTRDDPERLSYAQTIEWLRAACLMLDVDEPELAEVIGDTGHAQLKDDLIRDWTGSLPGPQLSVLRQPGGRRRPGVRRD